MSRRRGAARAAVLASAFAVLASGAVAASGTGAATRHLTIYSVAIREQFVNNSDARSQGVGNNPFGNFRDLAPATTKNSNGPFPGDDSFFSFNLYADAGLHKRIGAALFTCQYNFAKNAYCDASFHLTSGGTLVASGAFNFEATQFTLAVTGGYGPYTGNVGSVGEGPSANHAQRLDFELTSNPTNAQRLDLFSVGTRRAFIDNIDDLARGEGKNPFGNYSGSSMPTQRNERLFGPFTGDQGLFAANVFSDAKRRHGTGSGIVICQYNFNMDAFCDASLQLEGGTLVAKGAFNFTSTTFSLSVLGGTEKYRSARGSIQVTTAGVATQPQPVRRIAPMLQQQHLVVKTSPARSGSGARSFTVFSAATHEAFVNNDDDEKRGETNNPYAVPQKVARVGNGPFPGDAAVFTFAVYPKASLRSQIGSSVFTCQYYFDRNAFCDASFRLARGTLFAAGAFNFDATRFRLAVTGGTGDYSGAAGEIAATPSGKHGQRLVVTLT